MEECEHDVGSKMFDIIFLKLLTAQYQVLRQFPWCLIDWRQ